MEQSPEESKEGLYDVYYTTGGKKLIVLEGLSPNDQFEPPVSQTFIHSHYDGFALFYMSLYGVILVYVTSTYVVKPLLNRWRSSLGK
jgi:hypothetical protein